jgi:hypothetical protein
VTKSKNIRQKDIYNLEIIEDIPFKVDYPIIAKRLYFHFSEELVAETLPELLNAVVPLAKPKAAYIICQVVKQNGDSFVICEIKFTNTLLRSQFNNIEKVFPFIVTCGREVDLLRINDTSAVKEYGLYVLKETIMSTALSYLHDHLKEKYSLEFLYYLSPGEFQAWPLSD